MLILTPAGESVLAAINHQARNRNLHHAGALGRSEITRLRRLLARYRAAVED